MVASLPTLPEEPFWTYRGVAESIVRLRRKTGGLLASHDYEVYRAGRHEYPDRKTIRQILGTGGREVVGTVDPPLPAPWSRAEDIYLLAYAHRRSVRQLAWRLGRSPRAVRRRLRRIRVDAQLGYAPLHVLDQILGLVDPGWTWRVVRMGGVGDIPFFRNVTRLGLSEVDLPRLVAYLEQTHSHLLAHARWFIEREDGPPIRRHVRYWGSTLVYLHDDYLLTHPREVAFSCTPID